MNYQSIIIIFLSLVYYHKIINRNFLKNSFEIIQDQYKKI